MDNSKRTHTPFLLQLLVIFYTFGAVVLLLFLFVNPSQTTRVISEVHGLPASTGSWILPFIAGVGLLIAYGLFARSRRGYVLTILYLAYFGYVNGLMLSRHTHAVYIGNLTWSLLVIIYLILVRRQFWNT